MIYFLKFLAAIFTFTLGVAAFLYLAPMPSAMPIQYVGPGYVTVADLAREPKLYDGKLVKMRVHVQLMVQGNGTLTDDGSGPDWLDVLCQDPYTSCDALLEDIRDAGTGPVEIDFTGRFFHRGRRASPATTGPTGTSRSSKPGGFI